MSSIREMEESLETNSLSKELVYSVNQIMEAADTQILSHQQIQLLSERLIACYPDYFRGNAMANESVGSGSAKDPEYGAEFDLAGEVNEQIRAVRALRNMVMDADGNIIDGRSARDVKELIGSSNTLLASLMKFHDKIINQNRMRLIEQATIEAVKTLPEAEQKIFFDTLEEGLERIQ